MTATTARRYRAPGHARTPPRCAERRPGNRTESAMNLIHATRRPAGILLWLASVVLASLTAAMPPALAASRPPPGGNKHPPLPAHAHPPATGVIPGWQLTLMAVTVVLLAAVLVTIAYPGPGRPAAAERTHPPSDDHLPRHADPQEQPAALARPIPARQNHRAGPRP